jgi:hypothetical protein
MMDMEVLVAAAYARALIENLNSQTGFTPYVRRKARSLIYFFSPVRALSCLSLDVEDQPGKNKLLRDRIAWKE